MGLEKEEKTQAANRASGVSLSLAVSALFSSIYFPAMAARLKRAARKG
jgi:O-acetyl-ADP-ribose deacetylase (regulator of RNase III)